MLEFKCHISVDNFFAMKLPSRMCQIFIVWTAPFPFCRDLQFASLVRGTNELYFVQVGLMLTWEILLLGPGHRIRCRSIV
jgi:hypothetical protein